MKTSNPLIMKKRYFITVSPPAKETIASNSIFNIHIVGSDIEINIDAGIYKGVVAFHNHDKVSRGIKTFGAGARYWKDAYYNVHDNEFGNDWYKIPSTTHYSKDYFTKRQQELILRLLCEARSFIYFEYEGLCKDILKLQEKEARKSLLEKIELLIEVAASYDSGDLSNLTEDHSKVCRDFGHLVKYEVDDRKGKS